MKAFFRILGKTLSTLLWLLLVPAIVFGYIYFIKPKPCTQPIKYSIGTFDTRFGITQKDFLDAIEEASEIWHNTGSKTLFAYDPEGKLTVSLIYDDRQKETQVGVELHQTLAESQKSQEVLKTQIDSSKAKYASLSMEYETLLAEYNQKRTEYESQVNYWNSRGGAPKSEYATLTSQKNNLITLQTDLNNKRVTLNGTADNIKTLVTNYNSLVSSNNAKINQYNNGKYVGTEFNEGLYIQDKKGTRIEIYQFTDKAKLTRVLAHELGHALGLEHNDNPKSIMYALNESYNDKPTQEDSSALSMLCGF